MPPELAIAQFIAYVALTISGLTVAVVSLLFSYRQNFGWRPLLLVTSHGLQGMGSSPEILFATLDLEIWNRRKYPLVLRDLSIEFSKVKLKEVPFDQRPNPDWLVYARKSMRLRAGKTTALEPTAHLSLRVAAPFERRPLDGLVDNVVIRAVYYDPRKNRVDTIVTQHRWFLSP